MPRARRCVAACAVHGADTRASALDGRRPVPSGARHARPSADLCARLSKDAGGAQAACAALLAAAELVHERRRVYAAQHRRAVGADAGAGAEGPRATPRSEPPTLARRSQHTALVRAILDGAGDVDTQRHDAVLCALLQALWDAPYASDLAPAVYAEVLACASARRLRAVVALLHTRLCSALPQSPRMWRALLDAHARHGDWTRVCEALHAATSAGAAGKRDAYGYALRHLQHHAGSPRAPMPPHPRDGAEPSADASLLDDVNAVLRRMRDDGTMLDDALVTHLIRALGAPFRRAASAHAPAHTLAPLARRVRHVLDSLDAWLLGEPRAAFRRAAAALIEAEMELVVGVHQAGGAWGVQDERRATDTLKHHDDGLFEAVAIPLTALRGRLPTALAQFDAWATRTQDARAHARQRRTMVTLCSWMLRLRTPSRFADALAMLRTAALPGVCGALWAPYVPSRGAKDPARTLVRLWTRLVSAWAHHVGHFHSRTHRAAVAQSPSGWTFLAAMMPVLCRTAEAVPGNWAAVVDHPERCRAFMWMAGGAGADGERGADAPDRVRGHTPVDEGTRARIDQVYAMLRAIGAPPKAWRRAEKRTGPNMQWPWARRESPDEVVCGARATASSSLLLAGLCVLWYLSSAFSSNTSKGLLSSTKRAGSTARAPPVFPYPVALTLVQFVFVHAYCYAMTRRSVLGEWTLAKRIGPISWRQMRDLAQVSVFNVVGHALGSVAISRVPVSMVHTVKALSPLFTVVSYAYFFHVAYSPRTYASLLPLTLGVVLACSTLSASSDDVVGFGAALGSTFIFVAQNIYSKKLLRPAESVSTAPSEKLDKVNILYYTSGCSIALMLPMFVYYDIPRMAAPRATPISLYALYLLWVNGLVHFAQNLLAFQVLAHVSPVTYSIANLFKRVFVILLAIAWFGQSVTRVQWVGIALTFAGLYLYNSAKNEQPAPRAADLPLQDSDVEPALPVHTRARWHARAAHARATQARATPGDRPRPRQTELPMRMATPLFSLPPQ
ncbi:hypothetical protein MSPP1_004096 [Malassezia sp. CBS 17886]|nr:hypothetical protein MSPP1_004096 [Malassezia sp. CBS 17886]